MRVYLTGASGFVGSNIERVFAARGAELVTPGHKDVDLTDRALVRRAVAVSRPDAIVHAAIWNDPAGLRRDARGGSVVNIVTMASHGGEPVLMAYSASKGALATLTRNLGYSLQPDRIRVNGLNIGWTATEGEHGVQTGVGQPPGWLAEADASRPFGRLLRPEDIAPMVTYLLSDAARMVTGSVVDFDQTVHGPYGEHVIPEEAAV